MFGVCVTSIHVGLYNNPTWVACRVPYIPGHKRRQKTLIWEALIREFWSGRVRLLVWSVAEGCEFLVKGLGGFSDC